MTCINLTDVCSACVQIFVSLFYLNYHSSGMSTLILRRVHARYLTGPPSSSGYVVRARWFSHHFCKNQLSKLKFSSHAHWMNICSWISVPKWAKISLDQIIFLRERKPQRPNVYSKFYQERLLALAHSKQPLIHYKQTDIDMNLLLNS